MPGQEHDASSTYEVGQPWRVRFCRQLWGVLLYVWGTIIVGIAVGTISNLNITTTDTPLTKLFIVHLALTYPIPIYSGFGILFMLTLLSWLGSRDKQARLGLAPPLSEQDRVHMLRRLHVRYDQQLTQSMQGTSQMELGLAFWSAAVQNPASPSSQFPDQSEQPLLPRTTIVQAYEQAQQELLILGEPGAGKSTLLVELARHLVELAERDSAQLLPVLVPLSSWATNCGPLRDWLAEQVALLYVVPLGLSLRWVDAGLVLPLLDGLDEVEESARAACIAAINTYHRDHLRPLVVCSRTGEYEMAAVGERLALHAAVVVQPLTHERVDVYLKGMGRPLAGLRAALRKNTTLRELTTTPLMLQVLMLTYHGTPVRQLSRKEAKLREQVWEDYVRCMIDRKGNAQRYALEYTLSCLHWLAQQMRAHNQSIFYLEQLQPDWLPVRQSYFYRWTIRLIGGLLGLLFGTVINLIIGGLFNGLIGGLVWMLLFMWFFGRNRKIEPVEVVAWSHNGARLGLVFGLIFKLVFGFVFKALNQVTFLLTTPACVLVGMLSWGLSGKQLTARNHLTPNEGIRRSAKIGLVRGLPLGLIMGIYRWMIIGPINGLALGLFGTLLSGLQGGLLVVVRHFVLRIWLWRTEVFPWNAPRFLDDARARILLRRIGGGYSFTHRLLLDYFADLNMVTPLAQVPAQINSAPVQTKVALRADES